MRSRRTGHPLEDLGCIHHIAGEGSLAGDNHRRSWRRKLVSPELFWVVFLELVPWAQFACSHHMQMLQRIASRGDDAPLLRILRTLVVVTLACHCGIGRVVGREMTGRGVSCMRSQQRRLQAVMLRGRRRVGTDNQRR